MFGTKGEHLNEGLAEIRKSFGLSQEELAERIGKDVSTISRWERGKTREPLLSPLINVANRKYQYVKNMVDPVLLESVYNDDEFSGIYYGMKLMIICMSRGKLKRYPFLRATYGFEAVTYFRGEGRRLYNDNIENMQRGLVTPGSSAIVHVPGNSSILIKEPFRIEFNYLGRSVVYATSRPMNEEEAMQYKTAQMEFFFG